MAQHLEQVRLAAAEEAADPCGFLVGLAQAVEVRADDPLHAIGVLALAHKRRELAAQLFEPTCDLVAGSKQQDRATQRNHIPEAQDAQLRALLLQVAGS